MADEKNKKNNDDQQKKEGTAKKKKENNNVTVVLEADLHCEGCVSKVLKCIRSFNGVENATIGDGQRITVVGKVDPVKLRERLEKKTHKKVEIISPAPPKKDDNKDQKGKEKDTNGGKNGKQEKKKETKGDRSDANKSKENELPVTTTVLRMHLHCHGCIQKIYKLVTKTKGYQDMKIDKQKELVTVTGAIDMDALAKLLKKHLKKEVEILPPKKEVEKKDNKGGEKAKAGGGDKAKAGGDSKGKNGGVGGGDGSEKAGGEKVQGNKAQPQVGHPDPFVYGSGVVVEQFQYNPCEFGSYHAPQIFSDENPNACSVM